MSTAQTDTPAQRRLQRAPDFTGGPIKTFRDAVLRHGLPGALLALMLLLPSSARESLWLSLERAAAAPARYLTVTVLISFALLAFVAYKDRGLNRQQIGWCFYLGALSLWEEWAFRVALPPLLAELGLSVLVSVLISNALFGAAHYVTLRWKWQWCLAAALGGLALSRNYGIHGDLLAITFMHWIGTYINTPRPPGSNSQK